MSLLIYDYLLTFDREVTLVWNQPRWTYTKVIFLLARYLPFPAIFLLLYDQVFIGISPQTCKAVYYAAPLLCISAAICAESILMVRTWAVWNQDKRIAACFVLMACGTFIAGAYEMIKFGEAIVVSPAPFSPYRGCFVTGSSKIAYFAVYNFAVVDAVIFALMAFSAFKAYKLGNSVKLSKIVHRDGLLFYFYVLCVALLTANVVRFAPPTLTNALYPFPTMVYAVLSVRVIFNIRSVGSDPANALATELHTVPIEAMEMTSESAEYEHHWIGPEP